MLVTNKINLEKRKGILNITKRKRLINISKQEGPSYSLRQKGEKERERRVQCVNPIKCQCMYMKNDREKEKR